MPGIPDRSSRPPTSSPGSRPATGWRDWCGSRYVDRVARGLSVVVNTLDPDVLVMGGGMSNIDELYRDLPGLLAGYTFSPVFETPIGKARSRRLQRRARRRLAVERC